MIKEYLNDVIGGLPLSSIVMVIFFILFVLIVVYSFKMNKSYVNELSGLPIDELDDKEMAKGVYHD